MWCIFSICRFEQQKVESSQQATPPAATTTATATTTTILLRCPRAPVRLPGRSLLLLPRRQQQQQQQQQRQQQQNHHPNEPVQAIEEAAAATSTTTAATVPIPLLRPQSSPAAPGVHTATTAAATTERSCQAILQGPVIEYNNSNIGADDECLQYYSTLLHYSKLLNARTYRWKIHIQYFFKQQSAVNTVCLWVKSWRWNLRKGLM